MAALGLFIAKFNVKKCYFLPTECIYALCTGLLLTCSSLSVAGWCLISSYYCFPYRQKVKTFPRNVKRCLIFHDPKMPKIFGVAKKKNFTWHWDRTLPKPIKPGLSLKKKPWKNGALNSLQSQKYTLHSNTFKSVSFSFLYVHCAVLSCACAMQDKKWNTVK